MNATERVFDSITVTATNTYYSDEVSMYSAGEIVTAIVDFVQTVAGLIGTLTIEVANGTSDEQQVAQGAASTLKWVTYTRLLGSGLTVTNGAISTSGTQRFPIDLEKLGYRWIRLKYVNTSGTGTLLVDLSSRRAQR